MRITYGHVHELLACNFFVLSRRFFEVLKCKSKTYAVLPRQASLFPNKTYVNVSVLVANRSSEMIRCVRLSMVSCNTAVTIAAGARSALVLSYGVLTWHCIQVIYMASWPHMRLVV